MHVVKTQQWQAAIPLDKRHHDNGVTHVAQTLFGELTKKYQLNNVELQRLHDVVLSLIISFLLLSSCINLLKLTFLISQEQNCTVLGRSDLVGRSVSRAQGSSCFNVTLNIAYFEYIYIYNKKSATT